MTIATAALTARSMGLAQSLPWIPTIPIGRRSRRQPPKRPLAAAGAGGGDGRRRAVVGVVARGPSRSAPLPQPPPPAADDARPGRARRAARQDLEPAAWTGSPADEKRRLNELSKRMRNRK